jgi:phage tail-like protein
VRAIIEGLETPHPIGLELPGLFHDDDFTQRFTAALDEVLAPIFLTLDAIEAYVDPWLAPDDFLTWLSEWVGIPVEEDLPEPRKRAMVARAAQLYTWAGTARGIADLVETYTGVRPEVVDSGGVAFQALPGGDVPGTDDATVTVRIPVPKGVEVDAERVERLLRGTLPAHIITTIEVTGPPKK